MPPRGTNENDAIPVAARRDDRLEGSRATRSRDAPTFSSNGRSNARRRASRRALTRGFVNVVASRDSPRRMRRGRHFVTFSTPRRRRDARRARERAKSSAKFFASIATSVDAGATGRVAIDARAVNLGTRAESATDWHHRRRRRAYVVDGAPCDEASIASARARGGTSSDGGFEVEFGDETSSGGAWGASSIGGAMQATTG